MSLWSTCEICGRDIPEGELCYGLSNGGSICRDCCTGIENTDETTGPNLRWMDARKHPLPKGRIVLVCGARGYRAAFLRSDDSVRAVGMRDNLDHVEYWAEFNDALGHPTALPWERRVTSRFSPDQVREIRKEWERHGYVHGTMTDFKMELAKKYGCSMRTIQELANGYTYKDVQ